MDDDKILVNAYTYLQLNLNGNTKRVLHKKIMQIAFLIRSPAMAKNIDSNRWLIYHMTEWAAAQGLRFSELLKHNGIII